MRDIVSVSTKHSSIWSSNGFWSALKYLLLPGFQEQVVVGFISGSAISLHLQINSGYSLQKQMSLYFAMICSH